MDTSLKRLTRELRRGERASRWVDCHESLRNSPHCTSLNSSCSITVSCVARVRVEMDIHSLAYQNYKIGEGKRGRGERHTLSALELRGLVGDKMVMRFLGLLRSVLEIGIEWM